MPKRQRKKRGTGSGRRPVKRQRNARETLTPIPHLPDVPLINILNFLPMHELFFNVPMVDQSWIILRAAACRNRRHLSLSISEPEDYYCKLITDADFTPFDYFLPENIPIIENKDCREFDFPGSFYTRLTCSRLSRDLVRNLVHLFPKMETLEIACSIPSSSTFYQIGYLIEQWSSSLTTLRMWTWWETEEEQSIRKVANFMRLFRAINSCRTLKHFTFFANDYIWEIPEQVPPGYAFPNLHLSILSHLETFQFSTSDNPGVLFQSLATFGQANDQLRMLQLGNPIQHDVSHGPQLSAEFMRRFHSLTLTIFYPALLDLCFNAHNLRNLEIDFSQELNILQFFRRLEALNQLRSLKIYFSVVFSHLLAEMDSTPAENLPQLPSIRVIKLEITTSTHRVFHSRHLSHFFPGIEKVDVVHFLPNCTTCQYRDVYSISSHRLTKCCTTMLNNWKRCPTLKYIRLRPDTNEKKYSRKDGKFVRYSMLVDSIEWTRPVSTALAVVPQMHKSKK